MYWKFMTMLQDFKINGRNVFDQPINDETKTATVGTGQGDDYRSGCLLDYPYFKGNYKIFEIYLSKQQALDVDSGAIN